MWRVCVSEGLDGVEIGSVCSYKRGYWSVGLGLRRGGEFQCWRARFAFMDAFCVAEES